MKLSGEHCHLRAIEPHDVDHIFKWENDVDNWLVSGTVTPFSRQDLEVYVRRIRDIYTDRQLRLMICTEVKPVGAIDLYDFDPTHLRAGVGILIGEQGERRKGIAADALRILLLYAFDVLHLNQMYANIPENNTASIALFEQLGFQKTGTRQKWLKSSKGWLSEHMYQLFNDRK
ncbi:MAG: GNAT family N-acetyltransferase [Cryomorphaceae bacterium]|nr:GNAT family N-acetyltransferase [Cryomorphaceae bacterium]